MMYLFLFVLFPLLVFLISLYLLRKNNYKYTSDWKFIALLDFGLLMPFLLFYADPPDDDWFSLYMGVLVPFLLIPFFFIQAIKGVLNVRKQLRQKMKIIAKHYLIWSLNAFVILVVLCISFVYLMSPAPTFSGPVIERLPVVTPPQ